MGGLGSRLDGGATLPLSLVPSLLSPPLPLSDSGLSFSSLSSLFQKALFVGIEFSDLRGVLSTHVTWGSTLWRGVLQENGGALF